MVETCSWGDVLGVNPADETDAPDGMGPLWAPDGHGVAWSDAERAVWARLYDDPLYEIRTAVLAAPGDASATSPRALDLLRTRIGAMPDDPEVGELIPAGEPGEQFHAAVTELLRAQELVAALPFLAARASHDLVARSVTAAYIRLRERNGGSVLVSAAERDTLWRAVEKRLGGAALGVGDRARAVAWPTAQHMARPVVRRHRGALLIRATPALGDILLRGAGPAADAAGGTGHRRPAVRARPAHRPRLVPRRRRVASPDGPADRHARGGLIRCPRWRS
ncbi:hypothetical protein ACFP51_08895 [Streptomyces pratens]|uniref:Uncharacterized protein n=1 Tax=Streptomyces pratens TaxID=887456 RepID=A0ABW1LRW7_9ACTN